MSNDTIGTRRLESTQGDAPSANVPDPRSSAGGAATGATGPTPRAGDAIRRPGDSDAEGVRIEGATNIEGKDARPSRVPRGRRHVQGGEVNALGRPHLVRPR